MDAATALSKFHQAAFQPSLRPALLRELQSDPSLREAAQSEVARITDAHTHGMMMDRDAISRFTHDMLTELLRKTGR